MDDSLELFTMEEDMMLSQVSIVPQELDVSSGEGGELSPSPTGVRKPGAVFVDAYGPAHPLLSTSFDSTRSVNQSFEYIHQLNNVLPDEARYHHLYFGGQSPNQAANQGYGTSPTYAAQDEAMLMAEFFVGPAAQGEVVVEPVTYTVLEAGNGLPPQEPEYHDSVTEWLNVSASQSPASTVQEEPGFEQILEEIRDAAAEMESRSSHSASPAYDGEFEEALGDTDDGHVDLEDMEYDADGGDLELPKRKYSKRLGRPLTAEERRERKKAQNRAAAIRYRQKKQVATVCTETTLAQVTKRNQALRSTIRTTQAEIDIMKRLLRDVRQSMHDPTN